MLGIQNIFSDLPEHLPEEQFLPFVSTDNLIIERIVSQGHVAPETGWYDQVKAEWVILLSGAAELEFEAAGIVRLTPGDCVNIPAHCKHRVTWTDPERQCIWLAVHYRE